MILAYLLLLSIAITIYPPLVILVIIAIVAHATTKPKTVVFVDKVDINLAKLRAFIHMKSAYLRQPIWNSKRLTVLHRDNYECQSCGASSVILHVHHTKDYCLIPNEPTSSLVALCAPCHTYQHTVYGYPQTFEDYMSWNAPLKPIPKDLQ